MVESPLFPIGSVSETESARRFSTPHDRAPRRVRSKTANTKSEEEAEDSRDDAQEMKPHLDVTA